MVKFLRANFGVKEFHPLTKMYVDSNSITEIIEIMNNILGKKSDNEIFKFEPELEVNNQTNTSEEEVNPHDDDVSDLLRDKMVFDLVALEQSERKKSNDEETDANLIIYELEKIAETNMDGGDSTFKKFAQVLRLQPHMSDSHKSEAIFDSMKSMGMGKRDKGDTSSLQKTKSLLSRQFGVKKEASKEKPENASIIERGSIIEAIGRDTNFIVFEVYRSTVGNGKTGKWFPAVVNDNPLWPAAKDDLKSINSV